MDFLDQKTQIKVTDLRVGNLVYFGAAQSHMVTGISKDSIQIAPKRYFREGMGTPTFKHIMNSKEIVTNVSKVTAHGIFLNELNDFGFIWESKYKVYFLIGNDKFYVSGINGKEMDIEYISDTHVIRRTVYSMHELQNVFYFCAGTDFIDIMNW